MYSRHDITEKTAKVDVKRQSINYKEGFAPLDPSTTFMHPDNHYRSYAHHIHLVWIYLHMCQPWYHLDIHDFIVQSIVMVNLNIYFAYFHFVLASLCVFNQTNQVIIIMLYVCGLLCYV